MLALHGVPKTLTIYCRQKETQKQVYSARNINLVQPNEGNKPKHLNMSPWTTSLNDEEDTRTVPLQEALIDTKVIHWGWI